MIDRQYNAPDQGGAAATAHEVSGVGDFAPLFAALGRGDLAAPLDDGLHRLLASVKATRPGGWRN